MITTSLRRAFLITASLSISGDDVMMMNWLSLEREIRICRSSFDDDDDLFPDDSYLKKII